ncbi:MAG: hypothetical protein SAL07_15545 [Oscillatoria sp. PMC 1051.18]|nr:hypothetical protein [Oscillatoria sp. PMC 1050.18]MEC5031312.1 hypothetical protein [Oscillatoria sp. PMC 1051.18]
MTSFLAINNYSPLAVFLIGITTFIGILGIGLLLLHLARLKIPSPWRQVVGVLLGIQVLSLTVQIVGMCGIATQPVLISIWLILVTVGGLGCYRLAYPLQPPIAEKIPHSWGKLPLIIGIVALTINLLVAIAPSTKIDELHYHLLLPSRILTDHALKFYLEPLEGAILPHMHFQISTTPLHALGFPDAANVVSWSLSLILVWFGWYAIAERLKVSAFAYLCVTPIVVGIYPIVWYVTGGAHAMGDLATASAIVALFTREDLLKKVNYQTYGFICSLLVLSSVSSKVTLFPLGMTMLGLSTVYLGVNSPTWQTKIKVIMMILLPWLIFYLPLLIWTFLQSGSPFGPMLNELFNESIYQTHPTTKGDYLKGIKIAINNRLRNPLEHTFLGYSPLIWLMTWGIIFINKLKIAKRLSILSLFVFQILIIILFLTHETRYLGGIQYGIVILFGINISEKILKKVIYKYWLIINLILIVPWLSLQTYYAQNFVPVSLGLENKSEFYLRNIAFYQDYQILDRILPKDAALLIDGIKINSVYSPRPIYLNPVDLPTKKSLFLLRINSRSKLSKRNLLSDYQIGQRVYVNPQAIIQIYRVPGKNNFRGKLEVFALTRKQ